MKIITAGLRPLNDSVLLQTTLKSMNTREKALLVKPFCLGLTGLGSVPLATLATLYLSFVSGTEADGRKKIQFL